LPVTCEVNALKNFAIKIFNALITRVN